MYSQKSDVLIIPIVQEIMGKCFEVSRQSTCNSYVVGSILRLKNGIEYYGSSGNKIDSCTKKGVTHCTRGSAIPTLEEYSCLSQCAEGEAIYEAYFNNQDIKGAKLFSTKFPCKRCKDLILYFGIDELIFSGYKEESMRPHEKLYAEQMMRGGVKISEFARDNGNSKLVEMVFSENLESLEKESRESWKNILSDTDFHFGVLDALSKIKVKTQNKTKK